MTTLQQVYFENAIQFCFQAGLGMRKAMFCSLQNKTANKLFTYYEELHADTKYIFVTHDYDYVLWT